MLKRAVLLVAGWTVFGLLWSLSSMDDGDGTRAFLRAATAIVPFYWGWALMTPGVLWWARRVVARMPRGPRTWGALVAAAPLVVIVHGVVYIATLALLGLGQRTLDVGSRLLSYIWRHGGGDVATYLTIVGIYLLLDADRRAREREAAAAGLRDRLARADLELLRSQLQPHFLFNALNTVSTLVLKSERREASQAIELIARYLRAALAQRPDSVVTLDEELQDVRDYVAIETLRFGDGLRVEEQIHDEARALRLPGAILQPLVENAVRHGLAAGAGTGPIVIAASREGGRARLSVSDPGSGWAGEKKAGENGAGSGSGDGAALKGFGLRYVRERLAHFYGEDARLRIEASTSGTVATVEIPWR
jgi:signal transduction histidine kinase